MFIALPRLKKKKRDFNVMNEQYTAQIYEFDFLEQECMEWTVYRSEKNVFILNTSLYI